MLSMLVLGEKSPRGFFSVCSVAKVFFVLFCCFLSTQVSAGTRPTAVANQFYPGNPDELARMVDGFLASAAPIVLCATTSRLVGLISPHAGYIYSGPTSATVFKSVSGQVFDRVYFLGVDHHSGLPTISVLMEGGFDTPLGPVPLDASASEGLAKLGGVFSTSPEQHRSEHSLEVLMPFFIKTIGFRPAVFISVGGPPENGVKLGQELLRQIDGFPGRVLIVASSDWSHYHAASKAKTLDEQGIRSVLNLEPGKLLGDCRSGETELCGLNGVLALMTVMKAAKAKAVLQERTDSAAASGDSSRVVGYAGILMEAGAIPAPVPENTHQGRTTGEASAAKSLKEAIPMDFKKEALTAVRKTLEAVLAGKPVPELTFVHERFKEKSGVFVTLTKHGDLRGCIGMIEGREPLSKGIQGMAVAAATEDPRFPPVTFDELKEISIDISVLTPPVLVSNESEIQVGRDGVILQKGYRSGVFLPQVATEQGWDRETFLNQLDLKAGLPMGSHKEKDAKLLKFTADVFGEKEEK